MNEKLGKKQYLVPYLMSSHPGSTLKEAVELAEFLRDLGYMPEQVQDFYPTPSTISTCMYYTGLDPRTMEPVYVAVNPHEKAMQRALIQYRNPKNYDLVVEALTKAGRTDLIGFDKHCLIRPRREHPFDRNGAKNDRGNNSHRSSSKNDRDNFHSKNSVKNDRRTVTSGSRKKITASGNNQQNTGAKKKKTIRNIHKKK